MIEFTAESAVAGDLQRAWSVLADIERWSSWTPTVVRAEALQPGAIGVGSRFRLHQPKLPPAVWQITVWEPGRGFAWESRSLGLRVIGEHALKEEGGKIRLKLRAVFEGPLAWLIGRLAGRLTREYVEREADGFRRRLDDGHVE